MINYSPSNRTEFDLFLENNCYKCKKYNSEMRYDREVNTCDILFKLLDQLICDEVAFPEVFEFNNNELDVSQCPAICLKRYEINEKH